MVVPGGKRPDERWVECEARLNFVLRLYFVDRSQNGVMPYGDAANQIPTAVGRVAGSVIGAG